MKSTEEKLQTELTESQEMVVLANENHQKAMQDLQTWEKLKRKVGLTYESIALKIVNNAFKRRVQRTEISIAKWQKDVDKLQAKIIARKGKSNAA